MYKKKALFLLSILWVSQCAADDDTPCVISGGVATVPNGDSCYINADEYRFTLKGFMFRKTDGTAVVVTNRQQEFNAAGKNINAEMGQYIFNGDLPQGTFNAIVPILHRYMHASPIDSVTQVKIGPGGVPGAAPNVTQDVSQFGGHGGLPACGPDGLPTGGHTECWVAAKNEMHILHTDGVGEFTIGPDTQVEIEMGFDTSKGYVAYDNAGTVGTHLGQLMVTMVPKTTEHKTAG